MMGQGQGYINHTKQVGVQRCVSFVREVSFFGTVFFFPEKYGGGEKVQSYESTCSSSCGGDGGGEFF